MPSIYGEQQWCSLYPNSFSIVLQRRKVSSAPKPRTSEPVREVEKVRYSTGGGGSVGLGQRNRNYEAAGYQDEDIYEETS